MDYLQKIDKNILKQVTSDFKKHSLVMSFDIKTIKMGTIRKMVI